MPCNHVKEFLSRKGIPFTERNVALDDEARKDLLGMGFRATPVTVVEGQTMTGYNPQKLEALLKEAGL